MSLILKKNPKVTIEKKNNKLFWLDGEIFFLKWTCFAQVLFKAQLWAPGISSQCSLPPWRPTHQPLFVFSPFLKILRMVMWCHRFLFLFTNSLGWEVLMMYSHYHNTVRVGTMMSSTNSMSSVFPGWVVLGVFQPPEAEDILWWKEVTEEDTYKEEGSTKWFYSHFFTSDGGIRL